MKFFQMIVYIQDLCFQIMGIQVQFIEKLQNSSQQRVNLNKCEVLGSKIFGKPLRKILKPGVNGRHIFFAKQTNQLFFLGIREICSGKIMSKGFTSVEYILVWKEETIFQSMNRTFIRAV